VETVVLWLIIDQVDDRFFNIWVLDNSSDAKLAFSNTPPKGVLLPAPVYAGLPIVDGTVLLIDLMSMPLR
jgi:hypothetical protein